MDLGPPRPCIPTYPKGLSASGDIQQELRAYTIAMSGYTTTPTANGTGSYLSDADGQWINYVTAAQANRDAGWIAAAFSQVAARISRFSLRK